MKSTCSELTIILHRKIPPLEHDIFLQVLVVVGGRVDRDPEDSELLGLDLFTESLYLWKDKQKERKWTTSGIRSFSLGGLTSATINDDLIIFGRI